MWWRLILALAFVTGLCLHVSEPLSAGDDKDTTYIKVEVKGKLRTGIMAIGGETTGTIIETKAGSLELDFGENKELRELATKLDGKTAIATGTLSIRKGLAIKQRHIVAVTSLKAAEDKKKDN